MLKCPNNQIIAINFKNTKTNEVLNLIKDLNKTDPFLSEKYSIQLITPLKNIESMVGNTKFPVIIQDKMQGSSTDFLKFYSGQFHEFVNGVIIDHPEYPISDELICSCLCKSKEYNLNVILCATEYNDALYKQRKYKPDYIVFEKSNCNKLNFIENNQEQIKELIQELNCKVLFGGGVQTKDDVEFVLRNGGTGILISKLIINSINPKLTLEGLLINDRMIRNNYII
jgi:triosephosphate isomerase